MRRKATVTLVIVLLVALLYGVVPAPAWAQAQSADRAAAEAELRQLREFADKLGTLFQKTAELVSPAVVYISSEKTVRVTTPQLRRRDPLFERMFPELGPQEREYTQRGVGSGVIIDPKGYILTNNHVVAGADELEVKLSTGQSYKARLTGADPATELAVIKLEGDFDDLPTAKLGDSDELDVGEWVIAIGNPFGFAHTVSAGVVSAKGRALGMARYEDMIQTDAAINPGNSGGPLVNLYGEVVGINAAIFSTGTPGYMGIGFAIPINMAKEVLEDLKAGREVERGYLGIQGQDLTRELAQQWGFKGEGGALVNEVLPGTPAEEAKLELGDIITEWNGKKVKSFQNLRHMVAATDPGKRVRVKVWREGKELTLPAKAARLSEHEGTARADWLGLRVGPLSGETRNKLRRAGLTGVAVTSVEPNSHAAGKGMREGDVVVKINLRPVKSVDDYRRLIGSTSESKGVALHVLNPTSGRGRLVVLPPKR